MTRSSLPDIKKILKANPHKWVTYKEMADLLELDVTNMNKKISELLRDNFILKKDTRPLMFKLKIKGDTITNNNIDQILQKFLINVQEELIKYGFKINSHTFQERHLKIDMGMNKHLVKFNISWSY